MIAETLGIRPGVTAIIGSGGKTSLMLRLCEELPGTVIVCTSTHIWVPEQLPLFTEQLDSLPADKCCVGSHDGKKLTAPADSFAHLATLADYVLVEADGSRGLPLKAHADHEPVIPACADQVIQVLGLTGLYRPIAEAAHRPEIYAGLCGCRIEDTATPERAAAVLRAENLCTRVFLNQADTPQLRLWGQQLADRLPWPTVIGALQRGE